MNLLRLILIIIFISFTLTAGASSFECRNLFVSNTNHILEADIEKRIEALAVSFLKLSETNPESKQQVIAHVNKELTSLMQVNENSLRLFKQKISELKNPIENSRRRQEKEDESKRKEREKVIESQHHPVNLAKKMILHEIRPAKFMMGEIGLQVEVQITKPFAMMQTQVTQMMWARLKVALGEKDIEKINPSNFKMGGQSMIVKIEGIQIDMQPDHPVEGVTHTVVIEMVAGLNKLSNSNESKDQALLQNLIPGHIKGDVYDLPTEAQWELVMRNRGNANKKFFDRDDAFELDRYAWFAENSGNETHAVATKHPRMIDGKEFFDLEGNVSEWVKDSMSDLKGGVDPEGPTEIDKLFRVLRGGDWHSNVKYLSAGTRNYDLPSLSNSHIGFRLVRTRP